MLFPQLDIAFWPLIQVINFYYLPIALRLVFINSSCLIWSIVLSTLKHNVSLYLNSPAQCRIHVTLHVLSNSCMLHAHMIPSYFNLQWNLQTMIFRGEDYIRAIGKSRSVWYFETCPLFLLCSVFGVSFIRGSTVS